MGTGVSLLQGGTAGLKPSTELTLIYHAVDLFILLTRDYWFGILFTNIFKENTKIENKAMYTLNITNHLYKTTIENKAMYTLIVIKRLYNNYELFNIT